MEVRDNRSAFESLGTEVLAVGFSPPDALADLVRHLGWPWPFLSDPDRRIYRRLELPSVGSAEVWTGATKAIYRGALARGERVPKPVEDTSQLGGDAVVGHGRVLEVFRTASPDDRVPLPALLAALAARADRGNGAERTRFDP